ncbi:MAG: hypothetical protein V3T31_00100, partial [candidate division Zixibacteria bacterium]
SVTGTNVFWNEADSTVCFYSDCCIENDITVIATSECGSYSCSFHVSVQTNTPPLVLMPDDTAVFACDAYTACVPISVTDIDGNFDRLQLSGADGLEYDPATGNLCFSFASTGSYDIIVEAIDSCEASRIDTMTVNVEVNTAPIITILPHDTLYVQCSPENVRIPFTIDDPDHNIADYSVSHGEIVPRFPWDEHDVIGDISLTPQTLPIEYDITMSVIDDCGLTDSVTFTLIFEQATQTAINCPTIAPVELCSIGGVCFEVTIDGLRDSVSVNFGSYANDSICFQADTSGLYTFEIISRAECNDDTCYVTVPVTIHPPTVVSCNVGSRPEGIILCEFPTIVSFPFTITGATDTTLIEPAGAWLANDSLYYEVTQPGDYTFSVSADGPCNSDNCGFSVRYEQGTTTDILCPTPEVQDLCEPQSVCIEMLIDGYDSEVTTNFGTYANGSFCFDADTAGLYKLMVISTSYCNTDTCQIDIPVVMHDAPQIVCPIIDPEPVCGYPTLMAFPITISEVANVQFAGPAGTYLQNDTLYYEVTEAGIYDFHVWGDGHCGFDSCGFYVEVGDGTVTDLNPVVEPISLCDPGEVSVSLGIIGVDDQVTTTFGSYANNSLTFQADTSGTYIISVVSEAECNRDSVELIIPIEILPATQILCEADETEREYCDGPQILAIPVTITNASDTVIVEPASAWLANDSVYLEVTTSGLYDFRIVVAGECNDDSCLFQIPVTINEPPIVNIEDSSIILCQFPDSVRAKYSVDLIEDDLREVRTSLGVLNDTLITFEADTPGVYTMIVTAIDSCDLESSDTAFFTVYAGETVVVDWPTDTASYLVTPPTIVTLPLPVSPSHADVTVSDGGSYDMQTQELTLPVNSLGLHVFTVTVTSECGSESQEIVINTGQYVPPVIYCPDALDTAFCSTDTTVNICLEIPITGTAFTVSVDPIGSWANDTLCVPVDSLGTYTINIMAYTDLDTAYCVATIVAHEGAPPTVTLPADYSTEICYAGEVCLPVTIIPGYFSIDQVNVTGGTLVDDEICFDAQTPGDYDISIEVIDSCGQRATAEVTVTVAINAPPVVDLEATYDTLLCSAGELVIVPVLVTD